MSQRAGHSLIDLTGPTMDETVRWQIHEAVSQREMIESPPPVARNRPVGLSSAEIHVDVCPLRLNSEDSFSAVG